MEVCDKIILLKSRIAEFSRHQQSCSLCPRNCRVNRQANKLGWCGVSKELKVYTAFPHQGEEPPLSDAGGSGTIFFSGCTLKCIYCQNYKFSQLGKGTRVNPQQLAKIMLGLQKEGVRNINLVTPTQFLPQILISLLIALKQGLKIPLVYNTSGYEKKEIIAQLEGIIDIYLADLRYLNSTLAQVYSSAPDYPKFCQESLKEMFRQQPVAVWKDNLLQRGVIIRHLILPNHISESKKALVWIKKNMPKALVSVMFQYQPYFKAKTYPQINRPLNPKEYNQIKKFVEELGLEKGWIQEFSPQGSLAGVHFAPKLEKYI